MRMATTMGEDDDDGKDGDSDEDDGDNGKDDRQGW